MDLLDPAAAVSAALPDVRGKWWLAQWCYRRSARQGEWHIRMRRGHRMVVPRSAWQGWPAAFTGEYDRAELEVVLPYVEPGSVVLDVGASLGFWTLNLALHSPAARVVAFEPVAANRAVIERNLALNGAADQVTIHPIGLGAAEAEVLVDTESGGVGNAALVAPLEEDAVPSDPSDPSGPSGPSGPPAATARVCPLDAVDIGPGRCSFVKVDVEGFELDVLRGAEQFVREHRPVILAELREGWMERRGIPDDAPWEWARAHSYGVREVRIEHSRRNPLAPGVGRSLAVEWEARGPGELLFVPE